MPQPNELRVFISSTFRDLQEEREHLIKKIFPELRTLCRERGILFTEVDLRWGLTDEQLALGQVIRACLDEVDKCRPYFIGITGDRYGFIPTYLDIQKDPGLLEQYPWIEDAALSEMSITEMEAQYAVLGVAKYGIEKAAAKALFYFRRHRESLQDAADDDGEFRRLEAYQARIQESGMPIERFRDPHSLGEMVFDDLVKIIKQDFADARPPTPLEEERSRHASFSLSRRRSYIANPLYLKRLNDHVASDDPPLVVYAESGSGKSSLFAHWAEGYRRKHPEAHVIEHYVGIGATAMDHLGVIRHICMEIKERFGRDEEIPTEAQKLEGCLGQWLGYAEHGMKQNGERLVLILDGLNQLQGEALRLQWIPDVITPGIRMIVSSTVEGTLVELRKRGWKQYGMQALSEAERETIVVRYLAEYHKALNTDQIKRLSGDYKCGHPLFLKTVLEELRLVGRHEELDEKIGSYLEATGTEDLFQRMLERLEDDYSQRTVREVMVLIASSRSGLDEREVSEISGIARLKVTTMVSGLDYHLVRKGGYLTFFHDYLRRAVAKRYLSEAQKQRSSHQQIAEYFQVGVTASIATGGEVPVRMAGELAYQLQSAGAEQRLGECLSRMPVFLALYAGQTQQEVLVYWSSMDAGTDVAELYRRGLAAWAMEEPVERGRGMGKVSHLLERLGHWPAAIEIGGWRLSGAIDRTDKGEEAASRVSIGWLLTLRGEYAGALAELTQALELFTELGDRSGISVAIGSMGTVYSSRGEYDRALASLEQQLGISEELGDRSGISRAIGNMGTVYSSRGEYDRALESYEQQLRICEELGDSRGISVAMGNMGLVYSSRGEYDRALESYEQGLRICEELGDRSGISVAMGNMGNVYYSRGEYDRALESLEQKLRICEELGDRSGISVAMGNMGLVYSSRGEYDRALESYEQQLGICEELGDRRGISVAIGAMGLVYSRRGEYDRALASLEHQLGICEELGDRRGISVAIGAMGLVYSRRGEYDRALENFHTAANDHRAIGFRYGLTYWLAGTAGALVEMVAKSELMPEYLPEYLAEATAATWQAMALQQARTCATECVAISEELSKADTLFLGKILLARIEVAEGQVESGLGRLRALHQEASDDAERADLSYWLWKLGGLEEHRAEALQQYTTLFQKKPDYEYRQRIEELTISIIPKQQ